MLSLSSSAFDPHRKFGEPARRLILTQSIRKHRKGYFFPAGSGGGVLIANVSQVFHPLARFSASNSQ